MNAVYADAEGKVYDSPVLQAIGRTGADVTDLEDREWIPLPSGATVVSLPGTRALGLDGKTGKLKALPEEYCAVGALLPQGYTRLYLPAYFREGDQSPFPLFGYTAVAFSKGQFYVAAVQTDVPDLWDPTQYDDDSVATRVKDLQSRFPNNRLYQHLQTCAMGYECVTSRNTFFSRLEGAIPISGTCNAGCVGCISEQSESTGFPSPQTRLTITPTVDEMVELMVNHLREAGPDGVISFGQGCEGEPSLRGQDIAMAIKKTREFIRTGYININTNAGFTKQIQRIVDAGLNLMRISTISALSDHYEAYYRPRGYSIADVEVSARYAAEHGVIASLNYLVFPGVSDQEDEIEAMVGFIQRTGIRLVQFRNLNIDPDYYLARIPKKIEQPLGMLSMIEIIRKECPHTRIGNYTHPPSWFQSRIATSNME